MTQWNIQVNYWCDSGLTSNKLEDLFHITYKDFVIDVGFYGKNQEDEFFILSALKGDFLNGDLIEKFSSKTLHEIKIKVAEYCIQIPSRKLFKGQNIVNGLVNGKLF